MILCHLPDADATIDMRANDEPTLRLKEPSATRVLTLLPPRVDAGPWVLTVMLRSNSPHRVVVRRDGQPPGEYLTIIGNGGPYAVPTGARGVVSSVRIEPVDGVWMLAAGAGTAPITVPVDV